MNDSVNQNNMYLPINAVFANKLKANYMEYFSDPKKLDTGKFVESSVFEFKTIEKILKVEKANGLRVHFGKYPDDTKGFDDFKEYINWLFQNERISETIHKKYVDKIADIIMTDLGKFTTILWAVYEDDQGSFEDLTSNGAIWNFAKLCPPCN